MNPILAFTFNIGLTLLACLLCTRYLRSHMKRVLVELCITESRAQFWVVFSNILLIGLPLIIALGFRPEAGTIDVAIFEILGRLSGNLIGYLFALLGIGLIISVFALVAPRPTAEVK